MTVAHGQPPGRSFAADSVSRPTEQRSRVSMHVEWKPHTTPMISASPDDHLLTDRPGHACVPGAAAVPIKFASELYCTTDAETACTTWHVATATAAICAILPPVNPSRPQSQSYIFPPFQGRQVGEKVRPYYQLLLLLPVGRMADSLTSTSWDLQ